MFWIQYGSFEDTVFLGFQDQYGYVEYVVFFVDGVSDLERVHQRYDFCMNGVSDLS